MLRAFIEEIGIQASIDDSDWRTLEEYSTKDSVYQINALGELRHIIYSTYDNNGCVALSYKGKRGYKSRRVLVHSVFEEHETNLPKPNVHAKNLENGE